MLELRLTSRPPGGTASERDNLTYCVSLPASVILCGEKLSAALPPATCTVLVSPVELYADALMAAVPKLIPVILTGASEVVAPEAIKTDVGCIVTLEESLLDKLIKTPPGGAELVNVAGNATC